MSVANLTSISVLESLGQIVGEENLLTDEASCVLFAQDVHYKARPAIAVARPGSAEALSQVVKHAVHAGHAVIARGGGMSYTRGYVPDEDDSIIIDMSRMARVLEINTEDMYVRVECGCTWAKLHEALEETGLRTPYWGTLSGISATVGGGMSQNSIFWGSGQFGTAVDSLLALEVVLADGTVLHTGSGAQRHGSPFFRHYGPDLTGLFACDAGALGFKTVATLRLIPRRPERRAAAFDFADAKSLIAAMSDIGRADVAAECFAFDPNLQAVRMQRESLVSDAKALAGVMREEGSLLGALKQGAKVALAGRGFMKDVAFALNVMVEEQFAPAADMALDQVNQLAAKHGGKSIEPSIPKILRANPFTPLNNVVGPQGERWVPIHALLPHSKAWRVQRQLDELLDRHRDVLEQQGITVGFLYAVVSTNGFVIEPVFFTPDAMNELHRATVEAQVLKKLPGFSANPAARRLTDQLREEMIECFFAAGAIHMQLGKSYPYQRGLKEETLALVRELKHSLDPNCRINPGALGLHPPT